MSQLRTWQRRHAGVVAEVCPVPGMGTWEACAGSPTIRRRSVRSGLHFSLLTDAQDAADVLARAMMPHACEGGCEQWTAIERRKTPR